MFKSGLFETTDANGDRDFTYHNIANAITIEGGENFESLILKSDGESVEASVAYSDIDNCIFVFFRMGAEFRFDCVTKRYSKLPSSVDTLLDDDSKNANVDVDANIEKNRQILFRRHHIDITFIACLNIIVSMAELPFTGRILCFDVRLSQWYIRETRMKFLNNLSIQCITVKDTVHIMSFSQNHTYEIWDAQTGDVTNGYKLDDARHISGFRLFQYCSDDDTLYLLVFLTIQDSNISIYRLQISPLKASNKWINIDWKPRFIHYLKNIDKAYTTLAVLLNRYVLCGILKKLKHVRKYRQHLFIGDLKTNEFTPLYQMGNTLHELKAIVATDTEEIHFLGSVAGKGQKQEYKHFSFFQDEFISNVCSERRLERFPIVLKHWCRIENVYISNDILQLLAQFAAFKLIDFTFLMCDAEGKPNKNDTFKLSVSPYFQLIDIAHKIRQTYGLRDTFAFHIWGRFSLLKPLYTRASVENSPYVTLEMVESNAQKDNITDDCWMEIPNDWLHILNWRHFRHVLTSSTTQRSSKLFTFLLEFPLHSDTINAIQFPNYHRYAYDYRYMYPRTNLKILSFNDLRIGDIVDCSDLQQFYYESVVLYHNSDGVLIHYVWWLSKWDEWVDKTDFRNRISHRNYRSLPFCSCDTFQAPMLEHFLPPNSDSSK